MILTMHLPEADFRFAQRHAALAAVGGVSRIHDADERQKQLMEDQIVGQLGQIALHRYLFGHAQGYAISRYYQNKFPTTGDSGEDIPGANVDVKTSVMRYSQDPLRYNLFVRERERHEGHVYILALLETNWRMNRLVYLVGWVKNDELVAMPGNGPQDDDRYGRSAKELHPLPPIAYNWFPPEKD